MAAEKVTLENLKVSELKWELEEREFTKATLQQRLCEALKEEGEDPDSYLFEIPNSTKFSHHGTKNVRKFRYTERTNSTKFRHNRTTIATKFRHNGTKARHNRRTTASKFRYTEREVKKSVNYSKGQLQDKISNVEQKLLDVDNRLGCVEQKVLDVAKKVELKVLDKCNNLLQERFEKMENKFAGLRGEDELSEASLDETSTQENAISEKYTKINMKPPNT